MRSLQAFINLQGKESDFYLSRSILTNAINDVAPYIWGAQRQADRGSFNGVHWFHRLWLTAAWGCEVCQKTWLSKTLLNCTWLLRESRGNLSKILSLGWKTMQTESIFPKRNFHQYPPCYDLGYLHSCIFLSSLINIFTDLELASSDSTALFEKHAP